MIAAVEHKTTIVPAIPSLRTKKTVAQPNRQNTKPPINRIAKMPRHTMIVQTSYGRSLTNSPAELQAIVETKTSSMPSR